MQSVIPVILAAGRSTRFGPNNKLLAELGGSLVLERVLKTARAAGSVAPIVVTGQDESLVAPVAVARGGMVTHNPRFSEGMGSTIAAGVRAAHDAAGWLIWPGDMPFIRESTARAVINAFDPNRPVVPTYRGRRGHPVLFPACFIAELGALTGDVGARALLTEAIQLPVDDSGILRDIDVPEDLT